MQPAFLVDKEKWGNRFPQAFPFDIQGERGRGDFQDRRAFCLHSDVDECSRIRCDGRVREDGSLHISCDFNVSTGRVPVHRWHQEHQQSAATGQE